MSRIVRGLFANGVQRTWRQLYYIGDVKPVGAHVGTDSFGNKYYESDAEVLGRERWVEYVNGSKADGSQIPPDWHMWLHKMNDAAPTKVDLPHKHFERAFTENLTASNKAYVPYSTTVPKLEAWEARVARRG